MAYTDGLDVSHWQANVDWAAHAAAGRLFAWIKASEGTTFVDNKYFIHTADAKSEGFYVGPYHYFRVQYNGAAQAQHLHSVVGSNPRDIPPVIDVERYNNLGYSQAVFAARLRNCLLETEALFGVRPVIYTSRSMWHQLVGSAVWASQYSLWVAHYTTALIPLVPDDWSSKGWTAWQYTSNPLDYNRFNGDLTAFKQWAGIELPPPPPPSNGDWDEERVAAIEAQLAALHEAFHE